MNTISYHRKPIIVKNHLQNTICSAIIMLFLVSCGKSDNTEPGNSETGSATFQYLLGEATAETIVNAVAERKGKVVLLNMWATWCQPCVDEFPDIVMLQNKYKDEGLEVIAVSHDFVASFADSFLVAHKADFTNYLKDFNQDGNDFILGVDKDWYGALPATWLYDRNGVRQFFLEEQFVTEELEKKIVELLKQ